MHVVTYKAVWTRAEGCFRVWYRGMPVDMLTWRWTCALVQAEQKSKHTLSSTHSILVGIGLWVGQKVASA